MSVAKIAEITASSQKSFDDAIRVGLERAGKTLHNIQGAWIKDQKIVINNNTITEFRVDMKVTFVLND